MLENASFSETTTYFSNIKDKLIVISLAGPLQDGASGGARKKFADRMDAAFKNWGWLPMWIQQDEVAQEF